MKNQQKSLLAVGSVADRNVHTDYDLAKVCYKECLRKSYVISWSYSSCIHLNFEMTRAVFSFFQGLMPIKLKTDSTHNFNLLKNLHFTPTKTNLSKILLTWLSEILIISLTGDNVTKKLISGDRIYLIRSFIHISEENLNQPVYFLSWKDLFYHVLSHFKVGTS